MDLIDIPVGTNTAEAYVARPTSGSGPGVLLCMDAIGLRPQIAAMADRIASWGYVVLAPNVFHRSGTAEETSPQDDLTQPGAREAFFETVGPRMAALTPDLAIADLGDYVTTLRGLEGVTDGPLGVTGYCMGARLATWAGTHHPDEIAAVGGFHGGGLVTDDPQSPHAKINEAQAEFVYGHADNDSSMPPEAVAKLGETLASAGLTAKNEVYEGAAHGYSMADTSMYDEGAAERHFGELEGLLGRALG